MAQYKRHKCPQCAREFAHLANHQCPEQPEIVDWLARNLPDPNPARAGYIVTIADYDAIDAKPLYAATLKKHFGSWAALAARYSLKCPPPHGGPQRPRQDCAGYLRPEELAEIHRLAEALHAGDFGPSSSEFDTYAEGLKIGRHGIADRFPARSWHEVLEAAGLRVGTHSEYRRATLARQQANPKYQAQQQQIRQEKQGKAQPARYRYERDDEPIPRDYLGIMAADHNRLDGRRRPSAGYVWMLV